MQIQILQDMVCLFNFGYFLAVSTAIWINSRSPPDRLPEPPRKFEELISGQLFYDLRRHYDYAWLERHFYPLTTRSISPFIFLYGTDGGTRTRTEIISDRFSYLYGFHRRRETRRLWSGLSLHHSQRTTLDAARLVSTPSGNSPGLARDWHGTCAC